VVLAILTELCLLQAAAMRRKVKAVLPPEEDETGEKVRDAVVTWAPKRRAAPSHPISGPR
jgi:hypothetical protein